MWPCLTRQSILGSDGTTQSDCSPSASECSLGALWMLSKCSLNALSAIWARNKKIECSRQLCAGMTGSMTQYLLHMWHWANFAAVMGDTWIKFPYQNQIIMPKWTFPWLHNSLQSSSDAVLSIHIFMLGWHWVRVSWEMHSSQFPCLTNTFQTSKNPKIRQSGIIRNTYLCSPSSQILLKSLKISFSLIIPRVVCFQ